VEFDIVVADVDETPIPGETPVAMVSRLAVAKSIAVQAAPRVVVLGCDTTVALDGLALGKPRDAAHARTMLLALSGRAHEVITAFCLSSQGEVLAAEAVTTRVFMRAIDDGAAVAYIATGEPFGKAGAYAIQGEGGRFVDSIAGSYTNVMGLPVDEVLPCIARLVPAAIEPTG
jgi:septum formation protein